MQQLPRVRLPPNRARVSPPLCAHMLRARGVLWRVSVLQQAESHKEWFDLLDLRSRCIRRIPGPEAVWELAWSPDGRSLAVAGTDYAFALDSDQQEGAESQHSVTIISGLGPFPVGHDEGWGPLCTIQFSPSRSGLPKRRLQ